MRTTVGLLLFCAAIAAEDPKPGVVPDYTAKAGSHAIQSVDAFVLHDAKRAKDLQCRATFPVGKKKAAVLVFSHGLYGSKDGYQPLARFYASHGYVVLQANHPDSLQLGMKERKKAIAVAWRARPADVSFLLDSFGAIGKAVPALEGRLDPQRVAVAGHSFGAHTSQLISGVTLEAPFGGRPYSFRDKRPKAVVCISPQGPGGAMTAESWKTMQGPVMFLTGSKDESPMEKGKGGSWRRRAYTLAPSSDKYLVWIDGAEHGFGGITGVRWRGAGTANEDHVNIVKKTTLAFLDAYVRGNEKAKAYLASNGPAKAGAKTKVEYAKK